jgi:hypothetical protein
MLERFVKRIELKQADSNNNNSRYSTTALQSFKASISVIFKALGTWVAAYAEKRL